MDVDKAIAAVTAAGIELTDRRRRDEGDGWILRFSNGASLIVLDSGTATAEGRGADEVARLLDLPAAG